MPMLHLRRARGCQCNLHVILWSPKFREIGGQILGDKSIMILDTKTNLINVTRCALYGLRSAVCACMIFEKAAWRAWLVEPLARRGLRQPDLELKKIRRLLRPRLVARRAIDEPGYECANRRCGTPHGILPVDFEAERWSSGALAVGTCCKQLSCSLVAWCKAALCGVRL